MIRVILALNDLLTPFDSRTQKLTLAITESPENFIRFPGSWSLKILNRKFLMMNFFLFFPIRHNCYWKMVLLKQFLSMWNTRGIGLNLFFEMISKAPSKAFQIKVSVFDLNKTQKSMEFTLDIKLTFMS